MACWNFENDFSIVGKTSELGLTDKSFTIFCWVKLLESCNNAHEQYDQAIVAQREYFNGACLHIVIRNMRPYFGFYGHDTASTTQLALNKWYHLVFVYDKTKRTQSIYIDGVLDACRSNVPPLSGNYTLYYGQYAWARPLLGWLGAPLIRSEMVATRVDILNHIISYSARDHPPPRNIRRVLDESFPPLALSSFTTPPDSSPDDAIFTELFHSKLFADATIHCGCAEYQVHRIVLFARSDYFKALFSASMREQQEAALHLDDSIDPDAFLIFLKGLYCQQLDEENSTDVNIMLYMLQYCSRFQASQFSSVVQHYAIKLVTQETASEFQALAIGEPMFNQLTSYCHNYLALCERYNMLPCI